MEWLNNILTEGTVVWILRIIGATFASLTVHFLIDLTINPKWYTWNYSFLTCFILSIIFSWLDAAGESWNYIIKSGFVCSGGSMLLFFIGHNYGSSIINSWLKRKPKNE